MTNIKKWLGYIVWGLLGIFNWLFGVRGVADIKDLTRRKFTMGAQSVFALWTLCQPVIMFATDKTAIARMRIEYGVPANVLGVLVLFSAVALVFDVWLFLRDLHGDSDYTTSRVGQWVAHNRYWMLLACSFWAVSLMSTVRAEAGLGSWLAYGMYLVVQTAVGVALATRDGCIVNQKQKLQFLARKEKTEREVSENV